MQCKQLRKPISPPSTGVELQCESLTPLTAHKKAIEAYMKERPELKNYRLVVRNFEVACRI